MEIFQCITKVDDHFILMYSSKTFGKFRNYRKCPKWYECTQSNNRWVICSIYIIAHIKKLVYYLYKDMQ